MPAEFIDDVQTPGTRLWQRSGSAGFGSAFAAVLFGLMTLAAAIFAGLLFASGALQGAGMVLVALAFVGVMGALTRYVWREYQGKRPTSIRLDANGITLHLPAGRSLIHAPPSCNATVAWPDVSAVEARLEVYRAQGFANMQRAYRLVRRTGEPIFLFEERAIDSGLEGPSMQALALEIAARAGVSLSDLGMVRGRGGILAAWFTAPAPWTAAPLSPAEAEREWNRVMLTATVT
jgi:hypothetical protein